jgi:hypothetical protein
VDIEPQDQQVRLRTYELLLETGRMPKVIELAVSLTRREDDVRATLQRLRLAKAIALMPESGEISMASPWSAIPTTYVVQCGGRSWWANCAWDALAIPAAMGSPGQVIASCECCGEAMTAEVEGGRLLAGDGIVHIAFPARIWWDDIFFT